MTTWCSFIGEGELKVIDMEYAFCGPLAFDIGYLESHLISQYICAAFRNFDTERKRTEFQAYILAAMQQFFEEYCNRFFYYWNRFAKPVYRDVDGLQESFKNQLLRDMIGFCSTSNIFPLYKQY